MPSLNLCQFIGHCGADPEVRTFDNGNKIATTRIAVSERFTDRNNQQQERTEWVGLVFSGKLADLAEKYIRKGSTIYVSGKWHNREWQDQSGNKRTSTELTVLAVQLLDKRESQPQAQTPTPTYQQTNRRPAAAPIAPPAPTQYAPPAQPQPQYQAPAPQYPQQYEPQDNGLDLPF